MCILAISVGEGLWCEDTNIGGTILGTWAFWHSKTLSMSIIFDLNSMAFALK